MNRFTEWEMSGPEEGDTIDTRVFVCNHQADGYEVIEIRGPSVTRNKTVARRIAALLNETNAELL